LPPSPPCWRQCLLVIIYVPVIVFFKIFERYVYFFSVMAEPGMRLASLTALLETVGLSLDLSGRLPNVAVVDALAIGLIGQ
jgi:hypothetical protein